MDNTDFFICLEDNLKIIWIKRDKCIGVRMIVLSVLSVVQNRKCHNIFKK